MDANAIIALINATLQIVAQVTPLLSSNDASQVAAALASLQAHSDLLNSQAASVGE